MSNFWDTDTLLSEFFDFGITLMIFDIHDKFRFELVIISLSLRRSPVLFWAFGALVAYFLDAKVVPGSIPGMPTSSPLWSIGVFGGIRPW